MQNDFMETLIPTENDQSKDEEDFRDVIKINIPRQILAMLWKHTLQKWRMKSQFIWEFLAPALAGVCLHYLSQFFKCPEDVQCSFMQLQGLMVAQVLLMPLFMSMYVPNVTSIAARFIL